MRRKILLLGFVMIVLAVGTVLASQWNPTQWTTISNNYTAEPTKVTQAAQLMDIWIDSSTPVPTEVGIGQCFTILIDINNTNQVSVNAFVMLNVTSDHAITHQVDVDVFPIEGKSSVTLLEDTDPYKIVYALWNPGPQYIALAPGLNDDATGLIIQYKVAGTYTISLAVCQ